MYRYQRLEKIHRQWERSNRLRNYSS